MECKKCKKEIANTPYCQYCGAKQIVNKKKNVKKRGNGQGYARKRGNVWQAEVNFIHQGYRTTKTKSGFKTKKEALEYIPILRGETSEPKTIEDLYNIWSDRHYNSITDNKMTAYKRAYNRLSDIKFREIHSIRYDELQRIVDSIESYYNKRDLKTVIKGIYTVGRKNDFSLQDISNLLELGEVPKPKKEIFTKEEINILWENLANEPFVKYILIMIYTGMRPGELQNLTFDMIDFSKHQIIGAGIKTDLGKEQPIFYPDEISDILKDYQPSLRKKAFNVNFKRVITELGLNPNLTANCCRHTTATILAEKGVSPAIVQRILRHSTPTTALKNYTHISENTIKDTLNSI